MKNFSFKKSENKTKSTFELVHMDLVGPINESLFGKKYFLTILDDFSRFGWVFFLESKNDVFDKFLVWAKTITNMFNKSIIF